MSGEEVSLRGHVLFAVPFPSVEDAAFRFDDSAGRRARFVGVSASIEDEAFRFDDKGVADKRKNT